MSPRVKAVLAEVARETGVAVADLLGRSRAVKVTAARHAAMARIRALPGRLGGPAFSLTQIGALFGRHHTTVLLALRKREG